jgi:hypothetical protein
MKTYNKNSKSLLILFAIIGLAGFMLTSCSKAPVNFNYSPPIAGLAFIQASADEPLVDLVVNNSKYNLTPITYGQSFPYVTIFAGKLPVAVYNDVTGKPILTDTIQFDQNAGYSLFLCNTVSKPQLFLLPDTLLQPSAGNSGIRFVDLSPDAPAVDLVVQGGAKLASNVTFKGHSIFIPVKGDMFYTLEVHAAGTSTVLATLSNSKYQTIFLYTVYFHGLAAGTTSSDKLSVDIYTNIYFL